MNGKDVSITVPVGYTFGATSSLSTTVTSVSVSTPTASTGDTAGATTGTTTVTTSEDAATALNGQKWSLDSNGVVTIYDNNDNQVMILNILAYGQNDQHSTGGLSWRRIPRRPAGGELPLATHTPTDTGGQTNRRKSDGDDAAKARTNTDKRTAKANAKTS